MDHLSARYCDQPSDSSTAPLAAGFGASRVRAICMSVLLFALGCRHTLRIPNPRMSAPPGRIQQEYEKTHPRELLLDPSKPGCQPAPDSTAITEISLERSGCYGFCAMYTLTLRSDGAAEYQGYGNVQKLGTYRGRLDPATFRYIAILAEDIGFFSRLESSYACLITDQPTVFVSIVRNGERKTIRHYAPDEGGPPRFWWFEEWLDQIAENIKWQRAG